MWNSTHPTTTKLQFFCTYPARTSSWKLLFSIHGHHLSHWPWKIWLIFKNIIFKYILVIEYQIVRALILKIHVIWDASLRILLMISQYWIRSWWFDALWLQAIMVKFVGSVRIQNTNGFCVLKGTKSNNTKNLIGSRRIDQEISNGINLLIDHFVNAPSQWETTLHRNVVSHWLGAFTKWSLLAITLTHQKWVSKLPQPHTSLEPRKKICWWNS